MDNYSDAALSLKAKRDPVFAAERKAWRMPFYAFGQVGVRRRNDGADHIDCLKRFNVKP